MFIKDLYDTLARRARPEDVAAMIFKGHGGLSLDEKKVLAKATRRSWWASSMPQTFWRPDTMERQAKVAGDLIPVVAAPSVDAAPEVLIDYVGRLGATIA